jgi:hypothetical protein
MEPKIRIYDLAKELKCDNKLIIEEVRREGIDVSVPSDMIPIEIVERIRAKHPPLMDDKDTPMESIQIGLTIRGFWRAYPVRIPGHLTCGKCHEQTVLVQSRDGGFITRSCPMCEFHQTLPEAVFRELDLWVACPRCKKRMEPNVLADKNYGYVCHLCNVSIALFELLPRYEDL